MLRKFFFIVCSLFVISTVSYGRQDLPPADTGQKQFVWETMIASFSSLTDPGTTYVEIYMSILNGQFLYIKREDGNYYAFIQIDVEVKDKEENVVESKSWQRAFIAADPVEAEKKASVEIAKLLISPGTYGLQITITDLFSKDASSTPLSTVISVPRYPTSIISMSDIQFATNIETVTEESEFGEDFVKHGVLYVEPFPGRVYNNANPALFFYSEIYNLGTPKNDDDTYTVEIQILTPEGEQVYREKKPPAKKPESMIAAIVEKINILKIRNNYYTLYIRVTDDATGITTEKSGDFLVYKPNEVIAEETTAKIELEITPNNIQEHWDKLEYIITPAQKKTFESYEFEGKKKFIIDFWNSKPYDFYRDYMRRFNYAQENFRALRIEGWRTDRGRVYIMYGPPSQIEPHPQDAGMRPWTIWIYTDLNRQPNVIFYFGDLTRFGDYELLHTNYMATERGEIYDPDWRLRLIIK